MTDLICPHRQVADDGRLLCQRLSGPDREVDAALCVTCPARSIGCSSLRFTLFKRGSAAVLVRQAGGRSYWLDGDPPGAAFLHAACATRAVPIVGVEDCGGCTLRRPTPAAARPLPPGVIRFPVSPAWQPAAVGAQRALAANRVPTCAEGGRASPREG